MSADPLTMTLYMFAWHVGGGGWQHETFSRLPDALAAHYAHEKAGYRCGRITTCTEGSGGALCDRCFAAVVHSDTKALARHLRGALHVAASWLRREGGCVVGRETGIAWTDHTLNPWRGCTKVSAACANCYAETLSKRNPAVLGEWGPNGRRVLATAKYWAQAFAWDRAAERDGVRRKVFCASLADVFEDRPELEAQRDRLHATIALTPSLDWLLLTKRPEEARRYYGAPDLYQRVLRAAEEFRRSAPALLRIPISDPASPQGYANRWLGTSVEDQPTADARIPVLLDTPAAFYFVSAEPLLGRVDVRRWLAGGMDPALPREQILAQLGRQGIAWVIIGGESGPRARPLDIAQVRSVVEQCRRAGVPVFVKQDSGPRPGMKGRIPDDLWVKEFPGVQP